MIYAIPEGPENSYVHDTSSPFSPCPVALFIAFSIVFFGTFDFLASSSVVAKVKFVVGSGPPSIVT